MGDVDGNGDITASDSTTAMQAAVNTITLNTSQAIRADVDRSGTITASDANSILSYSVINILSFWPISTIGNIPTGQTSGVINNYIYRFSNTHGGLLWDVAGGSASVGTRILQYGRHEGNYNQKFKVTYYSEGAYVIKTFIDTTMLLSMNTNKEIVLSSSMVDNSKLWYFIPCGSGYYIVNKAYNNEIITSDGKSYAVYLSSSKNLAGGVWYLKHGEFSVKNYKDHAFVNRYSWAGSGSNDGITGANGINAFAADVFQNIFGVQINYQTVTTFESAADECKRLRGFSQPQYALPSETYRCSGTPESIHKHGYYTGTNFPITCTEAPWNCSEFRGAYSGVTSHYSKSIYWCGHNMWESYFDLFLNVWVDAGCNRSSVQEDYMHMVSIFDNYPHAKRIFLHEMAHFCGAKDHYHEIKYIIDNGSVSETCGSAGYCSGESETSPCRHTDPSDAWPYECIMNKSSLNFSSIDESDYDNIFCENCLLEMTQNIGYLF